MIKAILSDNHPANTEIVWETSNSASVAVKTNEDKTCTVTGVKAGGNARITVRTSAGASYTITITVTA